MLKRCFSVILAACMLFGIFSAVGFAEGDYRYSKIAYYKDGSEITGLTSGEITAKIKVKSDSASDELFFATILYKNNKLTDVSIDETPEPVSGTAVQYDAQINVPADLTGVKLVSVLWKNVITMEPVCSSSIVPSSETSLSSLYVDGVAVEGFDPGVYSYDIELTDEQIARSSAPYISYTAFDNGADVEVTEPVEFPGASEITVTANDGSSVTYTINYIVDELSMVEILSYTYSDATEGGPVVSIISENTSFVHNRPTLKVWYSPLLYGKTFVSFGANQTTSVYKIKRGANVSVFAKNDGIGNYPVSAGWSEPDSTGWDVAAENNWANDTVCSCEEHAGEHEQFGACYCVLDENGDCTGVSRIGNGMDEFPEEFRINSGSIDEAVWGSKYDVRKQGWFYLDYRETQKYRYHSFCAFTSMMSKNFEANSTVSLVAGGSGLGTPSIIEWDDWTPAVNPDADLEL